jgi:hypothetical protein
LCVNRKRRKSDVAEASNYGFSTILPNIWLFSM